MAAEPKKKNQAADTLEPDIPGAVRDELEVLTRTERAAVIMLLLGEQQAADILKYLSPREVQSLGACMVSVSDLSQEAVNIVLDDFVATIKKQTNLGLGTADYVENVFKRALGPDKAATVLGRILPGASNRGMDILRWMDSRSISEMIAHEHPQVIAIILSVLEYDVAADVLNILPPEIRPEVIQRVALLDTVQPSAMEELETIMKLQFSSNSSAKSSNFGGIKTAAKIMNFTKVELEGKILEGVAQIDGELCMKIQDNMFTFENLSGLDNRSVQTLMRNIELDMLMVALKASDEAVKEKFLDNMSQRAKVMFLDEMEAKGPVRITDVEVAQKTIIRIARKLSDKGDIMLAGRGDDFV
jgi:flagellar motor switch protein FliG